MRYQEQRWSFGLLKIKEGKDFMNYVSTLGCLVCGLPNPDCDHLNAVGMGGNRDKFLWEDFSVIPLCRKHHTERHANMKKFEETNRINCWKELDKIKERWHRYERD